MIQGALVSATGSQPNDSTETKSAFNTTWKVSTMVNPDGTVTIRRKVMNPDGSFTSKDELKEEECASPEKRKSELPTLQFSDSSDSISSITDMRTLSFMSTTSSKDDVFAGIEESPRRPKTTSNPVPFEGSDDSASQKESEKENEKNPPPSTTRQVLSSAGAETTKSSSSPVYEWDFKTLRDTGPLIDTRSADGFVEDFHPMTVSILKKQLDDKVGINVGLELIGFRDRLVVTKIAANGLFAESPIQEGDIVASINSHNFLENPHTEDALGMFPMFSDDFCSTSLLTFLFVPYSNRKYNSRQNHICGAKAWENRGFINF